MRIGIIGGGEIFTCDRSSDFSIIREKDNQNDYLVAEWAGVTVFHLKRHGAGAHSIASELVDNKKNIKLFYDLDVDFLLGITAVGSLTERFDIGDIVLPDQMIDFTVRRDTTYNTLEKFQHVSMKEPFSKVIRDSFLDATYMPPIKNGGTLVTIEGPQFSTIAENNMYKILGGDLINMSTAPEAKLARELDIHYQPLALVTDKDCEEPDLSLDIILSNIHTYSKNTVKDVVYCWLKHLISEVDL